MTAPHDHRPRRVRAGLAVAASLALAATLALIGPAAPATARPVPGDDPPASPAVEARLHSELAGGGETDFWVYLHAEPELSQAAGIADRAAQGRFVHEQLTSTAARSQAALLALLDAAGADHQAFWIANTVRVTGDQQLLERILTLPEVAQVTADRQYEVAQPAPAEEQPATDGVEWNIADIEAPRVWNEFGATGEGIVVGTIDTGVQYDHPALVAQYRGALDGGGFDHNYHWHDPSQICVEPVPCDNTGHGTHVTGTILGDDGGTNRIGVAPDAQWIAAKGCESSSCSQAALLSSGQFMLAPTDLAGENADPSRRPHVVNNSWGGAAGVDPWYRPTVQAWLAAGIFPQFSAGNTQFGTAPCGSASNPGNLPETYAVGAYDRDRNIAALSNRGPSAWGSEQVKPNIAAPGVAVRSAEPGDSYGAKNGTSMASPHVAGVVALMWSAAEALHRDIETTRELLDVTAIDTEDLTCGGERGNNNVWGQGRLNAYAAVNESPRGPTGTLHGVVTDAAGGEPIAGAAVTITGTAERRRTTGPDGMFSIALPVGAYEVATTAFGYEPTTVTDVVIAEQETTDVLVAMPPRPRATVAGRTVDANDGGPVAGVRVHAYLDGELVGQAETGATGDYSLDLPLGTYQLEVEQTNYQPESATVTLDAEHDVVPADFALRTARIAVAPGQLEPVLPVGARQAYTIDIDNQGSADAAFQVRLPSRPWASVDTSGGILAPGSGTELTLEFDTTWMKPGSYPLTLSVTSNSARQPVVELAVQLHVPELTGLEVTPATVRLRPGETQQHQATGRLADGTSMDVTGWAEWSSSDDRVVLVDDAGLVTTVGGVYATVTATLGEHTDQARYHVAGRPVAPPKPRPEPDLWSELEWQPTFFGPGVGGGFQVRASVVWDDGDGPALYAGGNFLTAGGHRVNHIARWDGQRWQPLTGQHGTGVNGTVNTLSVHDGTLVVAGQFIEAGGMPVNHIARWDGAEWSPLTGPLGAPGTNGEVVDVLEFEGDLLVGGAFAEAGGYQVNHIARWDGADWSALTSPDGSAGVDGSRVAALEVFNGDLIAGGFFARAGGVEVDHLARWDGERWSPLSGPEGAGTDSIVLSLAVYDGELIAGGQFARAGGLAVERIAAWDGARWRELDWGAGGSRNAAVYALTVHDGDLLVGGGFPAAGGAPASNIARWDGTGWSPLGDGADGAVYTVTAYRGELYVGGGFQRAGGELVNRIATWDGVAWAPLAGVSTGLDGRVAALATYRGELVAAGQFTHAGTETVHSIARWDGERWSPLLGPDGTGVLGQVDALLVHDGRLIVAGQFTQAGGVPANGVASWDGERWSALGGGVAGWVTSLVSYGGEVVAGGTFPQADGVTVNHVARWDGAAWSPLAGGLGGVNPGVEALAVHDGYLIAGGQFSEAGGVPVSNLARWDGQQWAPLSGDPGTGVNGTVRDLVVYEGALVAGGWFTDAGGVPASNVARWDGAAWSPLAGGLDGGVGAMTVFDGALVVGGDFTAAGGQTVNYVARWDGGRWSPLAGPAGTGTNASVRALATHPGPGGVPMLVAGGWFVATGGVAGWSVGWFGPAG